MSTSSHQRWTGSSEGLVFFFILISQVADVLQWSWGQIAGRHVVAKEISPSRTWEGCIGGSLSAGLVGACLYKVTPFQMGEAALISIIIAFVGFAGGMTMSAIKRNRNVQDYGTLVLGHAGVLDRIDTICFSAPVFLSHYPIFLFNLMFFDTHAHLADDAIQAHLEEILKTASNSGVKQILCVGTTRKSSEMGIEIARANQSAPAVYASVGIHPNYANQTEQGDWEQIVDLCSNEFVVALGETGLDKHWDDCPWETQLENLNRHWELSFETGLPVILHSRDCELDMLQELERARNRFGRPLKGVMHSFVGQWSTAEKCIELGLYISFAGMITFKKSEELRAIAARVPISKLLIETDSPYLTPEPYRGRRPNTPSRVIHTAECIAISRGCTLGEIAKITRNNACTLFSIS